MTSDEWIKRCVADIVYVAPEWRDERFAEWRLYPGLDVRAFDKAMVDALADEGCQE